MIDRMIDNKISKKQALLFSSGSFLITVFILFFAKLKAPFDILLADRFLNQSGWIEIAGLGIYSSILTHRFITNDNNSKARVLIWIIFSCFFFIQFILGVSGRIFKVDMLKKFLMTGKLHLPIPAVVIAGPIYRGQRFFMPFLFISTLMLTGPAWCSFLCYVGAWDALSATRVSRPLILKTVWKKIRFGILFTTIFLSLILRTFGVEKTIALYIALCFGIFEIFIMLSLSMRKGKMVNCIYICPLGAISNIFGKISPFRIRISHNCNECGRCITTCRYDALNQDNIKRKKVGYTCSLCGDCIDVCHSGSIGYSFLRLNQKKSKSLFYMIVISLHAVFLGVARI